MDLAKCVIVLVITFIANLSTYAAKMNNNLIYNAEEVNGVVVSETIFNCLYERRQHVNQLHEV